MARNMAPLPFFDSLDYVKKQIPPNHLSPTQKNDFLVISMIINY